MWLQKSNNEISNLAVPADLHPGAVLATDSKLCAKVASSVNRSEPLFNLARQSEIYLTLRGLRFACFACSLRSPSARKTPFHRAMRSDLSVQAGSLCYFARRH
jgi:hypothetical protein